MLISIDIVRFYAKLKSGEINDFFVKLRKKLDMKRYFYYVNLDNDV